jgi:RNA polymerase sigma factor (sigma-70 family)
MKKKARSYNPNDPKMSKFFDTHHRLIWLNARDLHGTYFWTEFCDLYAAAEEALRKAAATRDEEKYPGEEAGRTWARLKIRWGIHGCKAVRKGIPTRVWKQTAKVITAIHDLESSLHHYPATDKIVEYLREQDDSPYAQTPGATAHYRRLVWQFDCVMATLLAKPLHEAEEVSEIEDTAARIEDHIARAREAIEMLPEPERIILKKRYLEGESPDEIARSQNLSVKEVRRKIKLGLERMREILTRME